MVLLTLAEKIEIIELARNRTYPEAAEVFNNRYPNRARPLHQVTIARLFKKLREGGDLSRKKRTKSNQSIVASATFKDEVARRFNNNPHLSTRNVAVQEQFERNEISPIQKVEASKVAAWGSTTSQGIL